MNTFKTCFLTTSPFLVILFQHSFWLNLKSDIIVRLFEAELGATIITFFFLCFSGVRERLTFCLVFMDLMVTFLYISVSISNLYVSRPDAQIQLLNLCHFNIFPCNLNCLLSRPVIRPFLGIPSVLNLLTSFTWFTPSSCQNKAHSPIILRAYFICQCHILPLCWIVWLDRILDWTVIFF